MKPAGQMTLTLTAELEQFVRDEVQKGAYASSSESVRDLVRKRYHEQKQKNETLAELDKALERGIADAEAGRVMTVADAFTRLRNELSKV